MKKNSLIIAIFLIVAGLQFSNAQQVDAQNKIEYPKEVGVEDLNSITVPTKKVKKAKKDISLNDLERIVNKRRAKRYRKVRNTEGKCFKNVQEESSCHSRDN